MKLLQIAQMPTSIDTAELATIPGRQPIISQSLFRSYAILEKVKELLNKGTPPDVVLELIDVMENGDIVEEHRRIMFGRLGISPDEMGTSRNANGPG